MVVKAFLETVSVGCCKFRTHTNSRSIKKDHPPKHLNPGFESIFTHPKWPLVFSHGHETAPRLLDQHGQKTTIFKLLTTHFDYYWEYIILENNLGTYSYLEEDMGHWKRSPSTTDTATDALNPQAAPSKVFFGLTSERGVLPNAWYKSTEKVMRTARRVKHRNRGKQHCTSSDHICCATTFIMNAKTKQSSFMKETRKTHSMTPSSFRTLNTVVEHEFVWNMKNKTNQQTTQQFPTLVFVC